MATAFAGAIADERAETGGALARLRIRLSYGWRHRRLPDLDTPRRFTEWVQWRKLNERSAALARLTDKCASKALVAARLGSLWVVPTLWSGEVAPDVPLWPVPFVIKASHGCNQYAIVHDVARDWPDALARSRQWTRQTYGRWLDEWLAKNAPGAPTALWLDTSTLGLHAAVTAGLGVHFLACFDGDADPLLQRIGPIEPAFSREVWLLTLRELRSTRRVRAFMDHVEASLRPKATARRGSK